MKKERQWMKNRTALFPFLFTVIIATVCACGGESSSNLTVQIAPGTDLCAYATYDFLESTFPPPDPNSDTPNNVAQYDQVIKSTMSSYFTLLGLTADRDDPDLTVGILYNVTETSTPVQTCEKTQEGEWYGYPDNANCSWETKLVTVTRGSVMIDMIDMSTGGLVFRAIADGIVAGSVTVDSINDGLQEMFSYWPKDCGI
jgi:hypothetical protein